MVYLNVGEDANNMSFYQNVIYQNVIFIKMLFYLKSVSKNGLCNEGVCTCNDSRTCGIRDLIEQRTAIRLSLTNSRVCGWLSDSSDETVGEEEVGVIGGNQKARVRAKPLLKARRYT